MPIPDIKFKIVAGGQDQVKSALKTIEQAITAHQRTVQNLLKSSLNAETQLYHQSGRDQVEAVKNSHRRIEELYANMARRQVGLARQGGNEEVAAAKQTTHALEREAHRRNAILNSGVRGSLQAFGMNRVGGGLQAGQAFGGIGMTGMVAGLGVAALGYVVYKAFDVLTGIISSAVTTFASSIIELGGGFTVGGAIVKAGKNQKSAAQLAAQSLFTTNPLTLKEISARSAEISKGTEFHQEDIMAGMREHFAKTGKILTTGEGKSLSQMATFGGMSFADTAKTFATLQNQTGLNSESTIRLLQQMSSQAARGSLDIRDVLSGGMGPVMGMTTMLAGNDTEKKARESFGILQKLAGKTGSVSEAATQLTAFEMNILKHPAGAAALGIKFDQKGKVLDLNQAMSAAASSYITMGPQKFQALQGGRLESLEAVQGIVGGLGINEKLSKADQLKEVMSILNAATEEDLEAAKKMKEGFDIIADTAQYKLQVAFNDLESTIGTAILPILDKLVPKIKDFLDSITPEDITSAFKLIMSVAIGLFDIFKDVLLPVLMDFADILIWITNLGNPDKQRDLVDEKNNTFTKVKRKLDKFSEGLKDVFGDMDSENNDITVDKSDPNRIKFYTKLTAPNKKLTRDEKDEIEMSNSLKSMAYESNRDWFSRFIESGFSLNLHKKEDAFSEDPKILKEAGDSLGKAAADLMNAAKHLTPGSSDQPPQRPLSPLGTFHF